MVLLCRRCAALRFGVPDLCHGGLEKRSAKLRKCLILKDFHAALAAS
jgi:hypothetical protein